MLAGRRMPEEVCPVRDELLGELLKKRRQAASAQTATAALREAVSEGDIEEVGYVDGRQPDGDISPYASNDHSQGYVRIAPNLFHLYRKTVAQ
jgi:hypothetical protein